MPTFEYPPTFSSNHDIYHHEDYEHLVLLRHHFFLARLKEGLGKFVGNQLTPKIRAGLQNAIEHVLISQGYCAARALSVPSPYFLQELLRGFWPDNAEMEENIPILFSKIIPSAELNRRDSLFILDICGDVGCWWQSGGEVATFQKLNEMFWNRMKKHISDGVIFWGKTISKESAQILLDPRLLSGITPETTPTAPPQPASCPDVSSADACRFCPDDLPSAPYPPPLPNAVAAETREMAEVEMMEELRKDADTIGRLTRNENVTEQQSRQAKLRHKLRHLHQKLTAMIGRQSEIAEMEMWNLDASQSLMSVIDRFGTIPFPSQTEIYDTVPTSSKKESVKGKEKEHFLTTSDISAPFGNPATPPTNVSPKVPIFIRDPVEFQEGWWYDTMPRLLDTERDTYQHPLSAVTYVGPNEHKMEVFLEPIRRHFEDEQYDCPCGQVVEQLYKRHTQECAANILFNQQKDAICGQSSSTQAHTTPDDVEFPQSQSIAHSQIAIDVPRKTPDVTPVVCMSIRELPTTPLPHAEVHHSQPSPPQSFPQSSRANPPHAAKTFDFKNIQTEDTTVENASDMDNNPICSHCNRLICSELFSSCSSSEDADMSGDEGDGDMVIGVSTELTD